MSRDINALFESWAQWVHRGGQSGARQSVLYKMMITGSASSSGGGGYSPELYTVEAEIELALFRLVNTAPKPLNLLRVNVIRYEFGALNLGWSHDATQATKAHRLGLSLRSYRRHIKFCKDHVLNKVNLHKLNQGKAHHVID